MGDNYDRERTRPNQVRQSRSADEDTPSSLAQARERIRQMRANQQPGSRLPIFVPIIAGVLVLLLFLWLVASLFSNHNATPSTANAKTPAATAVAAATRSGINFGGVRPPGVATVAPFGSASDDSSTSPTEAVAAADCEAAPGSQPIVAGKVVATNAGGFKFQGDYAYVVGGCWTSVYYPVSNIDQSLLWQQIPAGKELGSVPSGQVFTYEIWQCSGSRDVHDSGTDRRSCTMNQRIVANP